MASQSAKKLAAANKATLKQTHSISVSVNLLILFVWYWTRRPQSLIPYVTLSLPAFFLEILIERYGRPKYSLDVGKNYHTLIAPGNDLNHEGLYEYFFDVIYITWILGVLILITGKNKVLWLYTIIPGYAIFKVLGIILSFFGKRKSKSNTKPYDTNRQASNKISRKRTAGEKKSSRKFT